MIYTHGVFLDERVDHSEVVWNAVLVLGCQQNVTVVEPDGQFVDECRVLSDDSQRVV